MLVAFVCNAVADTTSVGRFESFQTDCFPVHVFANVLPDEYVPVKLVMALAVMQY